MFFLVIETIQMRKDSRDKTRDLRETIESGPLCITDLFQNKSVCNCSRRSCRRCGKVVPVIILG